jgi:hypothetical protein
LNFEPGNRRPHSAEKASILSFEHLFLAQDLGSLNISFNAEPVLE